MPGLPADPTLGEGSSALLEPGASRPGGRGTGDDMR